jgi:hypothetical protein
MKTKKSIIDAEKIFFEYMGIVDYPKTKLKINSSDIVQMIAKGIELTKKITMDLNYLNEILLIREQEIKDGKNLSTKQPIYVVLELQKNYCSGHSEYESNTNYKGKTGEHGYIDISLDDEEREFSETADGMQEPEEVTSFYTDRIIAFFLTSEAAHDYLQYQSHNLSDGYVYVFYSGYGNRQMDKLLSGQ